MLGIAYAILSAGWFGVSTAAIRRGVTSGSATQALYVTVLGGVPLFLVGALITGQIFDAGDLQPVRYGALAAAGIIHFLIGRYCSYRAYELIGVNRSSAVMQSTSLLAVIIAMTLLDERVTLLAGVGIGLVLVGPALAASAPAKRRVPAGGSGETATNYPLSLHLSRGYMWAGLSVIAFGSSPVLIRYALQDSGLGVFGGLVSYVAAAAVLLPTLARPGHLSGLWSMDRSARVWFFGGGFAIFLAHMFRFLALSVAPVTIVVPLLRAQVVFALAMGYLINREFESFDRRVLGGIAIAMAGSVMLAV